ncbi:MAG: hypothetical protein KGJ95_05750 [Candidatus Omnitrophica bacterium]|nr:hypothetical protein [Candidatus Omnitrophota bacterium]
MSPYTLNIKKSMFLKLRRIVSIVIISAFMTTSVRTPAWAQSSVGLLPNLPPPGAMVNLSPDFTPAHLMGITIHPDNPLKFDFLIDNGDQEMDSAQKREEYQKLVKYFLASLTIPDGHQWVNLSPYEKGRIIQNDFGKTQMGRDLLEQDYILKQITSSLIYPESRLGKEFWDKVYQRAWNEYHTTDIPVNTFNKVWIVPDQAVVYESGDSAYILQSHLKVMLEEDYLSLKEHTAISSSDVNAVANDTHAIGSQVIREIVLPELQKEVNEDKNFESLRQMYSGMVLATWYKMALKKSLLGMIYADKAKVKGVDQDPRTNQLIYNQYLRAFKKGVFNYIKEDVDKFTNEEIPRKYFAGGFQPLEGADEIRDIGQAQQAVQESRSNPLPREFVVKANQGENVANVAPTINTLLGGRPISVDWQKPENFNVAVVDLSQANQNPGGVSGNATTVAQSEAQKFVNFMQERELPVPANLPADQLARAKQGEKNWQISNAMRQQLQQWYKGNDQYDPMVDSIFKHLDYEYDQATDNFKVVYSNPAMTSNGEITDATFSRISRRLNQNPAISRLLENPITRDFYDKTLNSNLTNPGKLQRIRQRLDDLRPGLGQTVDSIVAEVQADQSANRAMTTVLVIDDDPVMLDINKAVLSRAGYNVLTAQTEQEAETSWQENKDNIGLILSDTHNTGQKDWPDLVKGFVAQKNVPVLATSGLATQQAWQGITDHFLPKPYSIHVLTSAVQGILSLNQPAVDQAMASNTGSWLKEKILPLVGAVAVGGVVAGAISMPSYLHQRELNKISLVQPGQIASINNQAARVVVNTGGVGVVITQPGRPIRIISVNPNNVADVAQQLLQEYPAGVNNAVIHVFADGDGERGAGNALSMALLGKENISDHHIYLEHAAPFNLVAHPLGSGSDFVRIENGDGMEHHYVETKGVLIQLPKNNPNPAMASNSKINRIRERLVTAATLAGISAAALFLAPGAAKNVQIAIKEHRIPLKSGIQTGEGAYTVNENEAAVAFSVEGQPNFAYAGVVGTNDSQEIQNLTKIKTDLRQKYPHTQIYMDYWTYGRMTEDGRYMQDHAGNIISSIPAAPGFEVRVHHLPFEPTEPSAPLPYGFYVKGPIIHVDTQTLGTTGGYWYANNTGNGLTHAPAGYTDNAMAIRQQTNSESALIAESLTKKGGIDLNAANLNLFIKRDGSGVPLPWAQQDISLFKNIQGFVPQIVEIRPAVDISVINELQQKLQSFQN